VGIRAVSVIAVIVLSFGITACTGSGKPTAGGSVSPSASGLFSGTARAPDSSTATATATGSAKPTASATARASASPSASAAPSPTASSPYPTSAPVTGGGGTAGFQDSGLLAVGIACVAAGAGALAWRRRLTHTRSKRP
jgi:hypothetical protein